MIYGIGLDILEKERIDRALLKAKFIDKFYTITERRQLKKHQLANNFVAKEAVAKAFGLGFHKFLLRDLEVLRDSYGKPYVRLFGNAERIARQKKMKRIVVSITDTKQYIAAMAVLEK